MLTEKRIRALRPKPRLYRVADQSGLSLFIEVTPAGNKLWRYRYRFQGKEKMLSLGAFPDVSLAAARVAASTARETVAAGKNPSAERQAARVADRLGSDTTFRVVAEMWQQKVKVKLAGITAEKHDALLENDVFPVIGDFPIGGLRAADVVAVVRRCENRKAFDQAKRAYSLVGRVCKFAVASGLAERNPAADISLGDLLHPPPVKHHAAVLNVKELGGLLRAIDGYTGSFVVKSALQLMPLLACRPGELRKSEWSEFKLDAGEWHIPADRMKMRLPHISALSSHAVAILRGLHKATGDGKFVLPSHRTRDRPLSDNALNAALRRMGVESDIAVTHGFRTTFRTLADEELKERPDLLEAQLAHRVVGPLGRTYARMTFIKERKEVMERWGAYLAKVKKKPRPVGKSSRG
jgi:integrase